MLGGLNCKEINHPFSSLNHIKKAKSSEHALRCIFQVFLRFHP